MDQTTHSPDQLPLTFGKYRGRTPIRIAEIDPSYIVWAFKTISPKPCSEQLALACEWETREYAEEMAEARYYGMDPWLHNE